MSNHQDEPGITTGEPQGQPYSTPRLTVVGIGAFGRGGVSALQAFFSAVPAATGLTFVVRVHFSPEHESGLAELGVHLANDAFYAAFRTTPAQSEGRLIYELGDNQWDIPALRTLLEQVLPQNNVFNDFEIVHEFERGRPRTLLLNAHRLDHVQLILLAIEDITERKQAEAAL